MKKKSYVGRLGALALMLTVISTCLLGGTMARYVTEVTGSATATVAAWSFKANDSDSTFTSIDLASTSYTEATLNDGVIAPGTSGSFNIKIDGTGSDVGIEYDVAVKAASGTTLPDDLLFSTEEITGSNSGSTLDNLNIPTGTIDYSGTSGAMEKNVEIFWAWDFGLDDTTTDNDNEYAGDVWTLDITVNGKQIAPNEETTP